MWQPEACIGDTDKLFDAAKSSNPSTREFPGTFMQKSANCVALDVGR